MKKIKYLSLLLIIPLLSGCYNYRELNELAINTALSIDYSNNNFNVIVEVINPTKQQDAASANNSPFVNYYSSATTLQEAFRNIVLDSPRQLYAAQLEIIILSEEAATNHMSEILEFFSREPESRTEVSFIIAKGDESLKSITIQTLLTSFSSSNVKQSLDLQQKILGLTPVYTLNELLNMYLDPTLEINLPSIIVYGNPEEGDKKENITTSSPKVLTKVGTTAIFKGKDFLGYLTAEESKVHSIITGSTKESIITLNYKDNYNVFELYKIKSDISPSIKDNKITLNISGKARIKEFHSSSNITESKEIDNLNKELNKHIENVIKENFNSIRKKYNTDIFNFRQSFYREDPKYYNIHYKDTWYESIFPNLTLEVKSNIKLYEKGNTLGGLNYESKNN